MTGRYPQERRQHEGGAYPSPAPLGQRGSSRCAAGLLCIAANLERHGHDVRVNDLSGVPMESWDIRYADVYGITTYAPTVEISETIARPAGPSIRQPWW